MRSVIICLSVLIITVLSGGMKVAAQTSYSPSLANAGVGGSAGAMPALRDYILPEDEFLAGTDLHEEEPFGDKYLAYRIRLPKGWTKTEGNLSNTMGVSNKLLGEIGGYYGPANLGDRSTLVIQAAELEHQITAKNWFTNYIFTRGYTLQGLKTISEKRIEAVYVALEKDVSYIVRAVAEINGARIVMAIYAVPEAQWEAEKGFQTMALKSFRFISPEPVRIEETRTYAFLDLLRFDYPKSWRLMAPNIYSIESMEASIINSNEISGVLEGQIDIHVISTELDTTLAGEIKNVQSSLEKRGLLIGSLIEQPQEYKHHDHIYFSRIEAYQANDKERELVDYEYWIGVFMEDRYFYIVTMLTPSRTADFFIWARNGEAFKAVIQSLRP